MVKQIDLTILSVSNLIMDFICNLSPKEICNRKVEIENHYLGDSDDPWEWDWKIDLSRTPLPCANKLGYWQYKAFVV